MPAVSPLTNRLRAHMEGMMWQPIETAPRDGTEILVCRREFGRQMMCVARWDKNMQCNGFYRDYGWMMTGYQGIAANAVTPFPEHWMPLPAPPVTP